MEEFKLSGTDILFWVLMTIVLGPIGFIGVGILYFITYNNWKKRQ